MTPSRHLRIFAILVTIHMSLTDAQDCTLGTEIQLYTTQDVHESYSCQNAANLMQSVNFNPGHETVVIVIDYFGNEPTRTEYKDLKTELLNTNNVNVVVFNYTALSNSMLYAAVDLQTPCMAQCLGQFMQYLTDSVGQNRNKMHLIGVGLGAKVISSSATVYTNDGRQTYRRVTALDPDGPWYILTNTILDTSCADYVQIIVTNQGLGAKDRPVVAGTLFFYPDLGTGQWPCFAGDVLCPHMNSIKYFRESVINTNGFYGKSCTKECANYLPNGIPNTACTCTENFAYMGYYGNYDTKTGRYFFCPRNDLSPGNYGLGQAGVAFPNPTKPCCPPVGGQLTCPKPIVISI